MPKIITLLFALLICAGTAMAANNYTNTSYEIKDIALFSNNDTLYPDWAGFTSVSFTEPIVWAVPDVCNSVLVAIRPDDKHIIAAVMTAYVNGKKIRLYVDDAQKVGGNPCILRAVKY